MIIQRSQVVWKNFYFNQNFFFNFKRCFFKKFQNQHKNVDDFQSKIPISEQNKLEKVIKLFRKDLEWFWNTFKSATIGHFRHDRGVLPFEEKEIVKMWDFNQRNKDKISSYVLDYKNDKLNDINNWNVTCDSDYNIGFSNCSWTVSPSGYGLFSGYLDTTVPKDGQVDKTGYAYLYSYPSRKPFDVFDKHENFHPFTHLVMRVRGDGRRYRVLFDTSDIFTHTEYDRHQFYIFTLGGPHWQFIKIPLTRFFFQYKDSVQDEQFELRGEDIRSIGIMARDKFSGHFSLEIDYIAFIVDFEHNDLIEYESYFHESAALKVS